MRKHLRDAPTGREEDEEFSLEELNEVLTGMKNSAPGEDQVHPTALKHLPTTGKLALLNLINRSWTEGRIPGKWKKAIIVPILKKGKPASEVKSFRPVSLLSCISKVAESLVTARVRSWAKRYKVIPQEQAGFQAGRSTLDTVAEHIAVNPRRPPASPAHPARRHRLQSGIRPCLEGRAPARPRTVWDAPSMPPLDQSLLG